MTIDVITYNGEADLFDLRYNILKDYVDEFIVVEFDRTFSGKDKPWYFEQVKDRYPDVTYCQITGEVYDKYKELALSSPNTDYGKGAEHWVREFCQKESIKDCLTHLQDDDILYIGDCDEVWNKASLDLKPFWKLGLRVYTYHLNNRSSEEFWGTIKVPYWAVKEMCLNHLRSKLQKTGMVYGWHFTSLANQLERKLTDSYTPDSYANASVMNNLFENISNNRDFLGRNFTYKIDESEWPEYLKDNKDKYAHLCR